jgi:putative Mn2+ efflux pump MntP
MTLNFTFFLNAFLFGVGLAMDAFSVSLSNGLAYPCMKKRQAVMIAATFAVFQAAMPLIGWFLVTRLVGVFNVLSPAIPYVALALLAFIGGKMLYEGIYKSDCECESKAEALTLAALAVQGLATSIDALSVGLTISHLTFPYALLEAAIIAVVTFFICLGGIWLGRKFGTRLGGKASILGGVILIAIGFEIFISSFFS